MSERIDLNGALEQLRTALKAPESGQQNNPQRILFALTGVPGSGKSTLAAALINHLTEQERQQIICLPMDGFHLSKQQLQLLSNPEEAMQRRGAPWTFDSQSFIRRTKQLKQSYQKNTVHWPSFEHTVGDPIENDIHIDKEIKVILIEGLYLLHTADGWQESKDLFDCHWFLDIPLEIANQRLTQRHITAWEMTQQEAQERINKSDGLNAKLVHSYRHQADYLLKV
ncbi:hypothetical protein OFY17_13020 [Marinomonas sp. C2222]|uniref:Phosphoribulokinase/uridine kinase domain-containing protein n=1 Tax=Marinomonas sargassi TaxID=2984494 RepID=A0ABT2YV93_9GAMM|nr:hypothetical protein [Marinomonas sargassi]MCV2403788.1 hypothetical protein [Marinomonas sargassi]